MSDFAEQTQVRNRNLQVVSGGQRRRDGLGGGRGRGGERRGGYRRKGIMR